MTEERPTLRQQIEAVEWAARHFSEARKELQQFGVRFAADEYLAGLAAAAETLKTMEFAREVLK